MEIGMELPSSRLIRGSISSSDYIGDVEAGQMGSLSLYQALLQGDWETVESIIKQESEAITARITALGETPLLVAVKGKVKSRQRLVFIKKLIDYMPPEALDLADSYGNTALHAVAVLGNVQAAKLLVRKRQELPNIWNIDGYLPIHLAAMKGHREMTSYLFSVTKKDGGSNPSADGGATLMYFVVTAGYFDVALDLLKHNPELAWKDTSPLKPMAEDPSAFPSGAHLSTWRYLIYSCVPMQSTAMPENSPHEGMRKSAIKFHRQCENIFKRGYQEIWKMLEILVPPVERIRQRKLMHHQAIQLVKRVCLEIKRLDKAKADSILTGPLLMGAQNGIHEIVKEILESFPHAMSFFDEENHSAFQLAIMYRHENVYKIVRRQGDQHQRSGLYNMSSSLLVDKRRNNILHLVGYNKACRDKLDFNPGAVLQMQSELQWYKEVEKVVMPQERKSKNSDGKTPLTIFNEEHRELVAKETQWIISMATSCTVAASLIATVAFAATITIPGENNDRGFPRLAGDISFRAFAFSNALALGSSITAVIAFLSIFTSRYAVSDFHYALPNRLIIGLISLFLSVASLMIAFSSAIFLVAEKNNFVLIPIIILGCIPVTLFTYLQLPPLVDMVRSTYGPSIFK